MDTNLAIGDAWFFKEYILSKLGYAMEFQKLEMYICIMKMAMHLYSMFNSKTVVPHLDKYF